MRALFNLRLAAVFAGSILSFTPLASSSPSAISGALNETITAPAAPRTPAQHITASIKSKVPPMLKFAVTTALALGVASSALAKTYSGDYTVQFFFGPLHNLGASYCLALTETGTIAGFSNSGTFTDTDGYGFTGSYLVDGKSFHMTWLYSPFCDNTDMIGKAAKSVRGAFDEFIPGLNGSVGAAGVFTLIPGCNDSAQHRAPTHRTATY
jgi:hypothetical protein